MSNPFAAARSKSGEGYIHLALLTEGTPRLRAVQYQYPLKLISPAPITVHSSDAAQLVHTVYLLTYGGGIVAGDSIDLKIRVETGTRLTLLTQGSTKLFKSPNRGVTSAQHMVVQLDAGAALCYLPDPVQPFAHSSYQQRQRYELSVVDGVTGNLCVLDWVSNGRPANGEDWSFFKYCSYNEIYTTDSTSRRLLLRDNLLLDNHDEKKSIKARMNGMCVFGTMIICGPLYKALAEFFMAEFKLLPRVGARQWDDNEIKPPTDAVEIWRSTRIVKESQQNFLWSAAAIRDCVVVKFGACELEHGRHWLHDMLSQESSIVRLFGERALLCLR